MAYAKVFRKRKDFLESVLKLAVYRRYRRPARAGDRARRVRATAAKTGARAGFCRGQWGERGGRGPGSPAALPNPCWKAGWMPSLWATTSGISGAGRTRLGADGAYVCRPANLPASPNPGWDHLVIEANRGFRVGIFTVLGRQYLWELRPIARFLAADRDDRSPARAASMPSSSRSMPRRLRKSRRMGWHLDGQAVTCGRSAPTPMCRPLMRPFCPRGPPSSAMSA